MTCCFYILFYLIGLAVGINFEILGKTGKTITWNNRQGQYEQLLISQTSVSQERLLTQKQVLPYQYSVDQSCRVIDSTGSAKLLESKIQIRVFLQYTHTIGNKTVSKNSLEFSSDATIQIDDEYVLNLKVHDTSQTENKRVQNSLYLYNNQSLLQIDSRIYSNHPTCYMLSRMTESLCLQEGCSSLSPAYLYQMKVGRQVRNFSLVNDDILLTEKSEQGEVISKILCSLQQIATQTHQGQFKVEISQGEIESPAKNNVITAEFVQSSSKTNLQMPNQEITIKLKNTQLNDYAQKHIKIHKGNQLVLTDLILFKPSQQIQFVVQLKSQPRQLPSVEIYSMNMQLEKKFVMNGWLQELEAQTDDPVRNINRNLIPDSNIEEILLAQNHHNNLLLFILGPVIGLLVLLLIIVLFLSRQRIKSILFPSKQQQTNQRQQEKQITEQRKQSGRQLNIPFQVTFQKNNNVMCQIATASTLDRTNRSNPEEDANDQAQFETDIENKVSIDKRWTNQQQPQCQEFASQQPNFGPIVFQKRTRPFFQQVSLSVTTNNSQSLSKKRMMIQGTTKEERQDQETQNV